MTIKEISGGFYWPEPSTTLYLPPVAGSFLTSLALTAANQKVAVMFQAPVTGTFEKAYVLIAGHSVTGNLDFRLETVDAATGAPSGTLVSGTTANALVSITGNGVFSATLNVGVTKGTVYALVFARSAGTYSARCFQGGSGQSYRNLGVSTTYLRYNSGAGYDATAGNAPSRQRTPITGIKISGSYYPMAGALSFSAVANTTFTNATATRERGIAFELPFPLRANGFFACGSFGPANSDFVLANTAGTSLASFAFDKDLMTSYYGSATLYPHWVHGLFTAAADLSANTTYYLTAKPTSSTNIALLEVDIIDTADVNTMNCWNGGTRLKLVTRDSAGAYTVSTTKRPFAMGLIVSGFSDGNASRARVNVGMG